MSHINLVTDNIWVQVNNAPLREHDPKIDLILSSELSYKEPNYKHTWKHRHNGWNGDVTLYDKMNKRFRRGLLDRTAHILINNGYDVNIIDKTKSDTPRVLYRFNPSFKEYAFQTEAIRSTDNQSLGIIASPTGSGKTVCIARLIHRISKPALILVTDICLLDQMQQALQRFYEDPIGMAGDGEFDLQSITVSTIQSLCSIKNAESIDAAERRNKLIEYLENVGVVIADEAHLMDIDSVAQILPLCKQTDRFYSLSATPYGWLEKIEKRENLVLEQHFGRIIYDARKLDFVKLGLKVPVFVNVQNHPALNSEYTQHFKKYGKKIEPDFSKNYKECLDTELLTSGDYHQAVADWVNTNAKAGRSSFVHAAHRIQFGKDIQNLIQDSVLVNGSTPRLKRREIYDAIRKKELLSLVSDVGGTGLDIPSLDALVLASDLKDVRQLSGRVARAAPGKQCGVVVDYNISTTFLKKHHRIRHSQYEQAKYTILGG